MTQTPSPTPSPTLTPPFARFARTQGELGVTDFLVAYMSSHSKSSKINLVREFAESSTPIYLTTLAVISLTPGFLLGYASSNMCFTSRLENEDDWALTSCPMEYFEPISDMLRVDPKYL